jgi:hypothetical protein
MATDDEAMIHQLIMNWLKHGTAATLRLMARATWMTPPFTNVNGMFKPRRV